MRLGLNRLLFTLFSSSSNDNNFYNMQTVGLTEALTQKGNNQSTLFK